MKNAVDLAPNVLQVGINMGLKTQEYFRGFLVPSPFQPSSIDTTLTTVNQAGGRCGSPKNLTSNDMSLSAFGDQNDFEDITIETIRGGTPGNVQNPPMFKFYQTGESTEYGQFGRNALSGFEMIAAETSSNYNDPYFLPLETGDKLVAYQRQTGSNNKFLLVDKCLNNDTTSTWTNKLTVEISDSILSTEIICPSMVLMDDGSILLAHIQYDDNDFYNISLYRSTDDGEDWDLVSVGALPQKVNLAEKLPQKIRMAYSRGQLVLLLSYYWFSSVETNRNRIQQYLSINGGMSFSLIDESIQTDEYIYQPDLYTDINGDFIFTWIRDPDFISILSFSDGGSSIIDQIAGNDYHNIIDYSGSGSSALATCRLVSNRLVNGECTSYEMPNGEKHVLSRLRFTSGTTILSTIIHFSVDGQLNNFQLATQSYLVDHQDTQTSLVDIHARYVDGRSALFSSHIANPGPDDNSVHVIYYNTASTVSLEVKTDTGVFTNQFDIQSFRNTWFPFDEPHHTGLYTRTGSGSVTDIIQDGEYTITGNTGSSVYYTDTNFGSTSIIRFRVKPVLGGSSSSTERGVELIYDSGSNRYVVEIRIDTNAIDVFDVGGSSSLGNSSGHSSQQFEMLISYTGPNIIVYINYDVYRNRKNWTKIVESSVTSITSTGSENTIKWGHITTSTSSITSKWYEFHVGIFTDGFSTIPPLIGYPYPSNGFKQYVNGGCSISTIDGPSRIGDKYQIIKQYDHPLERVIFDVNTSPRIKWRSINTTSQSIVWFTYGNDTVTDVATNNMGAVTLLGCNFQSFTLEYELLGTFYSLGTMDLSDGLVCNLTRVGSTVRSQTAGGGYFYAFENEFAGCMCLLNFSTTNKYRKIISNSAGVMGSADGKPAVFVLDGIDNTEPITGTFKVFSKNFTLIHSVLSSSRWRITIPSQDNVDGYFEIGQIIHGSMFIFAPQYGRGRSITYQSNTDVIETPDNQIKTRVRSVGHRTARITWSDPVDQKSLFEASFTGDVYNMLNVSSIYDIANFGDVPYSLMGLYTYLDGAGKPVVYLPAIEAGSTARKLNRHHDFIYGITTSDISIDHVIGDENDDECFRISQIEIREIT